MIIIVVIIYIYIYIDTIISYYIEYMETNVFQPYVVTSLESRLGLGESSPNGSEFQVSEVFQFTQLNIPFGNKTWLPGKKPLHRGFHGKIHVNGGFFI